MRNVTRRRARTALIVGGLMLGTTIIASALASGDTMSHTIRSSAIESLGATDELVSVKGAEVETMVALGEATGVEYFSEDVVPVITHELLRSDRFDGVAPAIVEPVAVQNASARQNEPRVTLFASTGPNLAAFGQITTVNGLVVSLDDLQPEQVYLNEDAAEELLGAKRRQAPSARRRALDARARQGGRPTSTAPARTARRCSRSCRPRRRSSTARVRSGTC